MDHPVPVRLPADVVTDQEYQPVPDLLWKVVAHTGDDLQTRTCDGFDGGGGARRIHHHVVITMNHQGGRDE